MIAHPIGVVKVNIYDTDTEYKLAEEIRVLRKQFDKCERAFIFVSVLLVAMVVHEVLR